MDRYNHELEEDSEEGDVEGASFASFSSCSPRYHKITQTHSAESPPSLPALETANDDQGETDVDGSRNGVSRGDSGHSDQSESSRSTLESSTNTPEAENSGVIQTTER